MNRKELIEKRKEIEKKIEEIDGVENIQIHDEGHGWISCCISFDTEDEEVE